MLNYLIVSCILGFGQADISLPAIAKTEIGVFLPITATTKGEVVQFVALDPGLSIFPANLLTDKKTTVVVSAKSGKYRILAYTSIDNKPSLPAITTVVVGDPPPDNTPDPDKPKPPDPDKPKPPIPDDTKLDADFVSSIKSIFGGLQEGDKAASAKKLSLVYDLAATEAVNKTHKTVGDVFTAYKKILNKGIEQNKITAVRESIIDYLDSKLGTDPSVLNANLDDANRNKLKNIFSQLSLLLGGLNG